MMRRWTEKEVGVRGNAASLGRREESVENRHFVVVCGLPAHADGLVLLTNDGLFAEELTRPTSRIHTIYDVKIEGDPPPASVAEGSTQRGHQLWKGRR